MRKEPTFKEGQVVVECYSCKQKVSSTCPDSYPGRGTEREVPLDWTTPRLDPLFTPNVFKDVSKVHRGRRSRIFILPLRDPDSKYSGHYTS